MAEKKSSKKSPAKEQKMQHCPSCRELIPDGSEECRKCGSKWGSNVKKAV
jgi:ribosomal protein L40E